MVTSNNIVRRSRVNASAAVSPSTLQGFHGASTNVILLPVLDHEDGWLAWIEGSAKIDFESC